MGEECYSKCGYRQGTCEWCGTEGMCCTQMSGWNDTSHGCDGTFGGLKRHECGINPTGK